jgi:predicted transposase YdaD
MLAYTAAIEEKAIKIGQEIGQEIVRETVQEMESKMERGQEVGQKMEREMELKMERAKIIWKLLKEGKTPEEIHGSMDYPVKEIERVEAAILRYN